MQQPSVLIMITDGKTQIKIINPNNTEHHESRPISRDNIIMTIGSFSEGV